MSSGTSFFGLVGRPGSAPPKPVWTSLGLIWMTRMSVGRSSASTAAAVALFAIVKSPRYSAFTDFVEFQNAEYDLAVALADPRGIAASQSADPSDNTNALALIAVQTAPQVALPTGPDPEVAAHQVSRPECPPTTT